MFGCCVSLVIHWSDHSDANHYHHNTLISLVADAVVVEPVFASKFPANREKNREFHKIVASSAPETLNVDGGRGH